MQLCQASCCSERLLGAAVPLISHACAEMLDGYSFLALLLTCRAARTKEGLERLATAQRKLEQVLRYLRAQKIVPPGFCERDQIQYTLLLINPNRWLSEPGTPNSRRVAAFLRDNPNLTRENYVLMLLDLGLLDEPFWKSIGLKGATTFTCDDLPEAHEELLRVLDVSPLYAPGAMDLIDTGVGLWPCALPPKMLYYGASFGNFFCALMIEGVGPWCPLSF